MACYMLDFQEIDQTQVAVVGGKGAHLAELSRIEGIRVPPGFCVTTDAFRRIMTEAQSIDDRLDGLARLRVPPGTQSGQRFRVRERGAPSPRGGRRGDLVVEVKLVLPKMLDERSKELLREFGRINSEDVRTQR